MTSPHDTPMPRPYAMVVDDPDLDVTDTSYRNDEAPSIGWSDNDLEVYVQAWWGIDVPEAGPFQVSAQLPLAIEPDEALTDLHSWVPDGHSHSAATPCDTSTQAALLFIETLRRVRELLAKTSGTAAEAARGAAGGGADTDSPATTIGPTRYALARHRPGTADEIVYTDTGPGDFWDLADAQKVVDNANLWPNDTADHRLHRQPGDEFYLVERVWRRVMVGVTLSDPEPVAGLLVATGEQPPEATHATVDGWTALRPIHDPSYGGPHAVGYIAPGYEHLVRTEPAS